MDHEDIVNEIFDAADEFREALGVGTIKGFAHGAVRQDIYDKIFLKVKDDPWSTVMMSERERYASTHLWRERVSEFMVNGVYDKTGIPFDDFVKLPTYMVEHIFSTLRQNNAEARKGATTLETELSKQSDILGTHMKDRG